MNVQLLRTTPYLSGQQKLDVCLVRKDAGLVTGDCRFTPLTDAIPYTDSKERPFFNYSYQENLKWLKNIVKRDFYSDIPEIKKGNFLYDSDDTFVDPYDHSYACGMRRERYQKYKKQFSWLCPLWIEDESLIENLEFNLTLYGDDDNKFSVIHTIRLSNDLKKCLRDYFKGVSSKLLTINYNTEKAYIYGLNPSTGAMVDVDVSYIIPQLLSRERPVMETNSALNQLFASNNVIARQLINFNFCFNPEDIIGAHVLESAYFKRWKVVIEAYDGNKKLLLKDFYTNYDYVPSYSISHGNGSMILTKNALSYLDDNNYIEYADLNKSTQPDPYWSLVENPKYIYNLYNGFSSWYGKKQLEGLMYEQPDCIHKEYNDNYNNLGWCKVHNFENYTKSEALNKFNYIYDTYGTTAAFTEFKNSPNTSVIWANGLKYRHHLDYPIYAAIIIYNSEGATSAPSFVVTYEINKFIIFIPNNKDVKTKHTVRNYFSGNSANCVAYILNSEREIPDNPTPVINENYLEIKNVLKTLEFPTKIIFNKSILPVKEASPDYKSTEISYVKREYNVNTFVYRYSGDLRPFFIDPNDKFFYNINWKFKVFKSTDILDPTSDIIKYSNLQLKGYTPKFKSIGFYPLEGNVKIEGRIPYYTHPSLYDNIGNYEFTWYMDSRFYFLPSRIPDFTFIESVNTKIDKAFLDEKLYNGYLFDKGLSSFAWRYQLYKFYDQNIKYDYVSPSNILQLKFNTKYILK